MIARQQVVRAAQAVLPEPGSTAPVLFSDSLFETSDSALNFADVLLNLALDFQVSVLNGRANDFLGSSLHFPELALCSVRRTCFHLFHLCVTFGTVVNWNGVLATLPSLSRGNASIPSRRHRARKGPKQQLMECSYQASPSITHSYWANQDHTSDQNGSPSQRLLLRSEPGLRGVRPFPAQPSDLKTRRKAHTNRHKSRATAWGHPQRSIGGRTWCPTHGEAFASRSPSDPELN
jgi:hypothetical protein